MASVDRKLDCERAARHLFAAERNCRAIEPVSDGIDNPSVSDAYAIQRIGLRLRQEAGAQVVGQKVGLTSQAMQEMLGVGEPDFGYVLDSMVASSGASVSVEALIAPRVEPELAFILSGDLEGPGLTGDDVAPMIEVAMPALEIIDSRIADWRIKLFDTIADNASSAGVVLGDPIALVGIDPAAIEVEFQAGSEVLHGRGDAVLGNPLAAVAWLANTLGDFGQRLKAGMFVMSGAMTRALPIDREAIARARFSHLGAEIGQAELKCDSFGRRLFEGKA